MTAEEGRVPRILVSAGEASGDRLGAGLVRAIRERRPDVEFVGMGGPRMAEEGVRRIADANDVSVVGFTEVVRRLPALLRARRALGRALERERPRLFVPVDFPDFHVGLAGAARRAGVPVVYFVSPQIWAWRRGRVRKLRRRVRRVLVLFPFELPFYERAGVPVTFVGHPIAETPRAAGAVATAARRAGLDPARPAIALLPGSRPSEVARLLPPLLGAAVRLAARRPELQFLLPVAPGLDAAALRAAVDASGLRDVRLHAGDFPAVLGACAAGAVTSGTASLEAAYMGLPMVVVYRMSALSFALGRLLVRVPHVALPNLVAGRRLVPELIQGECTAERIAAELERYLDDPDESRRVRGELDGVRALLGGPGVFGRAADAVLAELERER